MLQSFHFCTICSNLEKGQEWIVAEMNYKLAELLQNMNQVAKEILVNVNKTNEKLDHLGQVARVN